MARSTTASPDSCLRVPTVLAAHRRRSSSRHGAGSQNRLVFLVLRRVRVMAVDVAVAYAAVPPMRHDFDLNSRIASALQGLALTPELPKNIRSGPPDRYYSAASGVPCSLNRLLAIPESRTHVSRVSVARPPHCLAQAEYDPLAGGCRTAGQPGLLRARCQLRGKLNVWRRIERRRYVVSWVSAAWGAFHFHGSSVSSSCRLVRPDTMRWRTSVSQANGSTSLSFAD